MSWEIRKNIMKVIEEASRAKSNLPEKVIDTSGDPEHESLELENVMKIELLNDFTPLAYPLSLEQEFDNIAAIDSSSRYLRDFSINHVFVGLAIYSSKKGFIDGPYTIKSPYLALSSYKEILEQVEKVIPDEGVRIKNAINYHFVNEEGNEYKIDDIADELRTEAENKALSQVLDHELVILDGPIYPTPLELTGQVELSTEARFCHKIAYAKLVKDRISLLRDNVVGVVKRLENSKKLSREEKIVKEFEKKGKRIENLRDPDVLELIDKYFCRKEGSYVCVVGPFKIDYNLRVEGSGNCHDKQVILSNPPTKYAYYVILRKPYYPPSYFRVEGIRISEKVLNTVFSRVSERLIPTYIELVDRRSKKISASLFIYAYEVASTRLSIIHDDKLMHSNVVREFLSESR